MPFASMDDIINTISTLGQMYRSDWTKTSPNIAASTAGLWHDLSLGGGVPSINAVLGSTTNLAFQSISDSTTTTATTAATSGSISTTTFTDTTHGTGRFTVGMALSGTGVVAGTYITALGTGTGANSGGTYTVNISQTVTSQTITGTAYSNGIYHGGNVSPSTKHLLNASFGAGGATSAPCVALVVDMLATYTVSSVTTTGAQNMTGNGALPRYAGLPGVQAYIVPVIATGAGAATIQLGYTNSGSTSGRFTPPPLPIPTASCPVGQILHSGTGAGKYGPFMPLQGGDVGIKQIDNINISTSLTSGALAVNLCRPLFSIPLAVAGSYQERDFLNMLPSLPRVYDGACLNVLLFAGAAIPAGTVYAGHMDLTWKT